jgi:hypothetical protein
VLRHESKTKSSNKAKRLKQTNKPDGLLGYYSSCSFFFSPLSAEADGAADDRWGDQRDRDRRRGGGGNDPPHRSLSSREREREPPTASDGVPNASIVVKV